MRTIVYALSIATVAAQMTCEDVPGYTYHPGVSKSYGGGNMQSYGVLPGASLSSSICVSSCNGNPGCMGFLRFGTRCNLFGYLPTPVQCTADPNMNVYLKTAVAFLESCGPDTPCSTPAPDASPCQCFANGESNVAFCERGAFPDAASCNANPRCHWGPEDNPSCRVGDPTPTPDPTVTPPAIMAPSPPSPAPTVAYRNCNANPCTDGTWLNGHGHTCADLRRHNNGAPDWTDTAGRSAGMQCCQFCLAPAPSPPAPSPPAPTSARPSWCRYYPSASACQVRPPRPSWCRFYPYHPSCYTGHASEDTVAKKTVSNGGEALLPAN